ncbi:MAG: SH3 domain-containing protein [Candidatus Aminicenantes bacterium]|nr:SH3 domain-containing protein [Candidatus Aminicenantes bacterium]
MKKSTFILFTILFLFLLTTIAQAETLKLRVMKRSNIRTKPTTQSKIITTVNPGTVLESIGKSDDWYQVNLLPDEQGTVLTGYIWENLVEVIKEEKKVAPTPPPEPPVEQPAAKRIGLEVKLTGGLNYLGVGDWNESMASETEQLGNSAIFYGGTSEGEFEGLHWGLDFGGDVIINLTPRFGITVGSGYIYGSKGPDAHKITIIQPTCVNTITFNTKVSAVPVKLGVYYCFPVSSNMRLALNGGVGYYFANFSSDYRNERDDGWWYMFTEKASSNSIGFQGGVGFEFDVFKNIALVIEGFGRYAKISGFEGNWSESLSTGGSDGGDGTLYHFEWNFSGDWYTTMTVGDAPPAEPNRRNVRDANIDFSGFAIRASIKVRLF